jgi:lysyl-tRNA synthetase class 1
MNKLRKYRNWDVYEALSDEEKKEITMLHEYIKKGGYSLDDLNSEIYAIPKRIFGEDLEQKQLKTIQGTFFKNVYKLIIDKEKGPRLYLFLYSINPEDYLNLLDFSYPKTEEELNPVVEEIQEEKPVKKKKIIDEPDVIEPVKDEINIEEFEKIDLRVCKVLKCSEIRKSHNCFKLVLDDGQKERTIVSSIKEEYTPEELVGRKIIVVANLKPARFSGVQSEGMLIAATNNSCGCNVIFVDDSVPVGTSVR